MGDMSARYVFPHMRRFATSTNFAPNLSCQLLSAPPCTAGYTQHQIRVDQAVGYTQHQIRVDQAVGYTQQQVRVDQAVGYTQPQMRVEQAAW